MPPMFFSKVILSDALYIDRWIFMGRGLFIYIKIYISIVGWRYAEHKANLWLPHAQLSWDHITVGFVRAGGRHKHHSPSGRGCWGTAVWSLLWDAAGVWGISSNSWLFQERVTESEHLWHLIFLSVIKKTPP